MKTEVEELEPTKVKLNVEVSYQELEKEINRVYKQVGKRVSIPGFRPGHVPNAVLDRKIGRAYIIEETINNKLSDFYRQALEENKLRPLAQPEIDVNSTPNLEGKPGGDLKFSATVEIVPQFELPSLEGLSLEVEKLEVTDDQVEQELDRLRERFASLKSVDREVQDGDFTVIDMVAKIDGEEVDSVSGLSYQVGSDSLIEGIDEAVVGLKADESKTFTSRLKGEKYGDKEAEVTVSVNAVKERELPEADDEFAEMASEFDTIGELRTDLRENVAKMNLQQQAVEARSKLEDYLIDHTELPLPTGVVAAELEERTKNSEDGEADQDEVRQQIEKSLKRELILGKLAEEKQTEVEPRELYQSLFAMGQAYGFEPMQILQDQNMMARISQDMRLNKALMEALQGVEVKDEAGNVLDLSEFLRSGQDAQAAEDADANQVSDADETGEEADSQ